MIVAICNIWIFSKILTYEKIWKLSWYCNSIWDFDLHEKIWKLIWYCNSIWHFELHEKIWKLIWYCNSIWDFELHEKFTQLAEHDFKQSLTFVNSLLATCFLLTFSNLELRFGFESEMHHEWSFLLVCNECITIAKKLVPKGTSLHASCNNYNYCNNQ